MPIGNSSLRKKTKQNITTERTPLSVVLSMSHLQSGLKVTNHLYIRCSRWIKSGNAIDSLFNGRSNCENLLLENLRVNLHDSFTPSQTLTGGLRLSRCPWYAVVLQLVLFAVPAALVAVAVPLEHWHAGGFCIHYLRPMSSAPAMSRSNHVPMSFVECQQM